MKKLYLHIGYPKCASTFLQKEIFRKNKKINYLRSKKNDVIDKNVELFWKNIYIKNNFYFKKNYKKDLYFLKNLNFKKTIIFSSEDITDYVKLKSVYHIDPNEVFRRIKTVSKFFKINFKIILVIRQQSDIIMSRFAQDHLFMNILPKYKNFSVVKKFFERKKKNKEEKKIFDSFNYYLTYKK